MGFFSWKTMDTQRSIPNVYSSRKPFPVTMTDNKGNKWTENEYEGYGIFGGKDFYELLAEMNGLGSDREKGIDLAFSGKPHIEPNLNEMPDHKWGYDKPEICEYQGYFYPDYDEDEF